MPLTVPEKQPPDHKQLAEKWLARAKERDTDSAGIAQAEALLAINDILIQIGTTLSWSRV